MTSRKQVNRPQQQTVTAGINRDLDMISRVIFGGIEPGHWPGDCPLQDNCKHLQELERNNQDDWTEAVRQASSTLQGVAMDIEKAIAELGGFATSTPAKMSLETRRRRLEWIGPTIDGFVQERDELVRSLAGEGCPESVPCSDDTGTVAGRE